MRLIEISGLLPHERTERRRIGVLLSRLRKDRELRKPILVAKGHGIILDGHHRVECLRMLGCRRVPAVEVDYSNGMRVETRRKGMLVDKGTVMKAAEEGNLLPPRTTRHIFSMNQYGPTSLDLLK